MTKLIPLSLSLLTLTACADPFDPGSLIVDTRVLGARVEVDGDEQRTTPRAGETAEVRFLVAGLTPAPSLRWALVACLADGEDTCQGAPLSVSEGSGVSPSLTVTVPAESELGGASSLAVLGIVCTRGEPNMADGTCRGDGASGVPLIYELVLARAVDNSDENLQPDLTQTRFLLDGAEWPASEPAASDGCEPGLPEVRANEKEHDFTFELGPEAREMYLSEDLRGVREELQISHFVTAGELSRQFTFIDPKDDSERPRATVKWTAPKAKELSIDRLRMRLLAVVRDQRGGIAQVERALCVVR